MELRLYTESSFCVVKSPVILEVIPIKTPRTEQEQKEHLAEVRIRAIQAFCRPTSSAKTAVDPSPKEKKKKKEKKSPKKSNLKVVLIKMPKFPKTPKVDINHYMNYTMNVTFRLKLH